MIDVNYSSTYGNYLKYVTKEDYIVMYAHLSEAKVKIGSNIKKGQIIALTGDTGLVTGPHLHYSVFSADEAVDPLEYGFYKK